MPRPKYKYKIYCNNLNGVIHSNGFISTSGYRTVKVLGCHHLRMANGTVYYHHLVAEQKLGRPLEHGELVHHINGNKLDNRPDNIHVCKSIAYHKYEHRSANSNLQKPDEPNPLIMCRCGCGNQLLRYDSYGRPREYIQAHLRGENSPKSKMTDDQVREVMQIYLGYKITVIELAKTFHVDRNFIYDIINQQRRFKGFDYGTIKN